MGNRVAVIAPDGTFGTIDAEHADAITKAGGRVLTQQQVKQHELEEKYDEASTGSKVAGALVGAGPLPPQLDAWISGGRQGMGAGLYHGTIRQAVNLVAGKKAGDAYEQHQADLKEAHPDTYQAGEVGGMIAGAAVGSSSGAGAARLLPGSVIGTVGGAAEGAVARGLSGVAARGVAGRAVATAAELGARGAVEGALYGAAQQVGEDMLGDRDLAADKIFAAAGTGALHGAVGGAALGGAGSLAASGVRAGVGTMRGGLARVMAKGERTATRLEETAAPVGREVPAINADAGLAESGPAAERAFELGAERRPVQLRPDVGQRGRVPTEEAPIKSLLSIDPDAGLSGGSSSFGKEPIQLRKGSILAGYGPEAEAELADDVFKLGKSRATEAIGTRLGVDADAGIAARGAGGKFQGKVDATEALRLSSAKNVARDVRLGAVEDLGAMEASSPIRIPKAPGQAAAAEVEGLRGAIANLGTESGTRGLAYEQAWKAVGAGYGLQSTRFAGKAAKFLPNGVRDVGEVMMRKGIINAEEGVLGAAAKGTPGEMLPRIEAELENAGARLGEITTASPARVAVSDIQGAINGVAKVYEGKAGFSHVASAVRGYGAELESIVGRNAPGGEVTIQSLLEQRKALDQLVYQEAKTLDPKGRVAALREVRTKLEDLITDALDDASGKVPGALKQEYLATKKDYLALSIAREAAEDSAKRASKGATLGLGEKFAVGQALATGHFGAAPVLALGGKLVRERGNAAAAVLLSKMADMGTLSRVVRAFDEQLGRSAKGLLAAPAKRPLPEAIPAGSVRERAEQAMKRVASFQADPDALVTKATRETEAMGAHAPEVASGVSRRMVDAYAFLASKVPAAADLDPLDPHPAPRLSDSEAASVARYAWYCERPARFFEEVEHGKLTAEGAETAQRLMPKAFAELQARTAEALATHMASGKSVPFEQRLRIGTLLDFAADPSQRVDHMKFLQSNVIVTTGGDKTPGAGPPSPVATAPKRPLKIPTQQSALDRLEGGRS
jgi:hypothetical protein